MARKTRVLGFSVPPEVAEEYERLAKRTGRSKSELFREMIRTYKARRDEEEFFRLQRKMARRARAKGVFSEKDVERLVFEDR
jgi:predicted DNA-binding protein